MLRLKKVLNVPTGNERLPVAHPSGCQQVAATFRYPAECYAPVYFVHLATKIRELFRFHKPESVLFCRLRRERYTDEHADLAAVELFHVETFEVTG